jgi:hypothetical protein
MDQYYSKKFNNEKFVYGFKVYPLIESMGYLRIEELSFASQALVASDVR